MVILQLIEHVKHAQLLISRKCNLTNRNRENATNILHFGEPKQQKKKKTNDCIIIETSNPHRIQSNKVKQKRILLSKTKQEKQIKCSQNSTLKNPKTAKTKSTAK